MVPAPTQPSVPTQPPVPSGPPAKLFVGQVSNATTEEMLRSLFSQFGTVVDVVILTDRYTGQRKGCGFVTMSSRSEGDAAILGTNDKIKLDGARRELIVRYAQDKSNPNNNHATAEQKNEHKIYVGMLSRSTTEEEINTMFEPYGTITEVFLMRDHNGHSKGCAFIKYSTNEGAVKAIEALNEKIRDKDAPSNVQVRFAQTRQQKMQQTWQQQQQQQHQQHMFMYQQMMASMYAGMMPPMPMMGYPGHLDPYQAAQYPPPAAAPPSAYPAPAQPNAYPPTTAPHSAYPYPGYPPQTPQAPAYGSWGASNYAPAQKQKQQYGPPGCNLFIYNVPENYSDQDLTALFTSYGTVVSGNVQRDLTTGRTKGYGFVSYDNAVSAQAAIKALDGFQVGGKKLNVRLKSSGNNARNVSSRYTPY